MNPLIFLVNTVTFILSQQNNFIHISYQHSGGRLMRAVWRGIPYLFTFALLKLVIHTCSSETCLRNVSFRYKTVQLLPIFFNQGGTLPLILQ